MEVAIVIMLAGTNLAILAISSKLARQNELLLDLVNIQIKVLEIEYKEKV